MKLKCKTSMMNSSHSRYLYVAGNIYMGVYSDYETHIKDEAGTNHLFDDEAVDLYFKKMPEWYNDDDDTGVEVDVIVKTPYDE